MSPRVRFQEAARAALFGWMAGWVAALPLQTLEAIRNAGIGARIDVLFGTNLVLSLVLWSLLTFSVSCYCCCMFFMPVVWLFAPARVVAQRVPWTTLNGAFGLALIALRAHVWTAFDHDGVGFTNFWTWALFACAFFTVAAESYLRQTRKILASQSLQASCSQPG